MAERRFKAGLEFKFITTYQNPDVFLADVFLAGVTVWPS